MAEEAEDKTDAQIQEEMVVALENDVKEADPEVIPGEGDPTEYSETEQQAIDMGWNPEGVDGKRNISAEEFVERSTLFDRIHKLERVTKTNDKVITALKKYNEQIAEKSYERAIKDLKQQKFQALEEGDNVRVLEIDDEIEKARADNTTAPAEPEENYSPEEWNEGFSKFAQDNIWYGRRPDLTQRADIIGTQYQKDNPELSPEEVFSHVKNQIKSEFKTHFEKPGAPNKVDTGHRKDSPNKDQKTLKDVPEEDREIALTLIRSGTITEKDYVKSYFG